MNDLQQFIASKPMGFLTEADMSELIKLDRLCPVLVRLGGGRFTCGAQDCAHLIECVEAGGDYVRDVSFPVGSIERAAKWQPKSQIVRALKRPSVVSYIDEYDEGGMPDGNQVHVQFNESDCGGVFDGNQVTSDADPGL